MPRHPNPAAKFGFNAIARQWLVATLAEVVVERRRFNEATVTFEADRALWRRSAQT